MLGFYPAQNRISYTEMGAWPSDAVELTDAQRDKFWAKTPPAGKMLGATKDGLPAWVALPAPTFEEVTAVRQSAYRMESDPLKNEADYDALEAGTEPDYTAWRAKVKEIKERHPLPDQE